MSNFHIGQRVVCISNAMYGGIARWPGMTYPEPRGIYTVREIYISTADNRASLLLHEIVNPIPDGFSAEWGFCAERFRPVIERKTDISIFQRLLVPANKQKQVAW